MKLNDNNRNQEQMVRKFGVIIVLRIHWNLWKENFWNDRKKVVGGAE